MREVPGVLGVSHIPPSICSQDLFDVFRHVMFNGFHLSQGTYRGTHWLYPFMYRLFVYKFWPLYIYITKRTQCHIPWASMGDNKNMPDVIFETVPFFAGGIYSGTTSYECSPEHFGKSRCNFTQCGSQVDFVLPIFLSGCIGWIVNMFDHQM